MGVVETDNPASIADWLMSCTDIISREITPIISDEEIGGLCREHEPDQRPSASISVQ